MIAVFHNNGLVQSVVYTTQALTEEELQRAVIVDEIPNPIKQNFIIWIDPTTKTITYEYLDTELQVKVKQLENENANINYALMMGGLI